MLSMTRTDIANYLGMAIETMSRVFACFKKRNIISVQLCYLSILDFAASNLSISLDACTKVRATTSNMKNINRYEQKLINYKFNIGQYSTPIICLNMNTRNYVSNITFSGDKIWNIINVH
jgi:hypothetical protein